MTLGSKIRKLRKNNNLTMKELGLMIGVSEQAVGQYERNEREPDLKIINKLAEIFKVSGTIFFDNSIHEILNTNKLLNTNKKERRDCIEGLNKDNIDKLIEPLPDELKSSFYALFTNIIKNLGLLEPLRGNGATNVNLEYLNLCKEILKIMDDFRKDISNADINNIINGFNRTNTETNKILAEVVKIKI